MIATPANGGSVTISYLRSLLRLQASILGSGSAMTAMQTESMFLPHARNVLATLFYEQPAFTHLLFIDSDMGFSPSLIHRMIDFEQPIVGVIAPHRSIDFANVAAAAKKTTDPKRLEQLSATFTTGAIVRNSEGGIAVKQGFVQVEKLGTGILLIRRDAIDRIASIPNIMGRDPTSPTQNKNIVQCFMPLTDDKGLMLSEDISFCVRWTTTGGHLWACIDEDIIHTGLHNVRARYIETLIE